ncbi:phosphonate metabolism transcriptional regulator PhnF [Microbacterium marinilacus]|uniref:Phosphonate metabolism transcriptional regulator PhnF n=1 Tax=Microbacterium marinilacus TaxID=415209 RepID=A0ABP7B542_9MICO|nr:phosphonate metabolism transcriptional regulator PhnF [Microbacterium marinilacus]MBY0687749.1 phosphonate metabolism transcriptional regulator PhnF [Microbacterium marinilacus]
MTDPAASRSTGYSAWRLIAEELRAEITEGGLRAGDRLPTENALAERFGVNRHTARQAVASLAADGLVESRRGSGTFVTGGAVHVHRIGMRTRLSTSIGDRHSASGRVLESETVTASPEIAERLGIAGGPVVRVESLRTVDGEPVALGAHWFDAGRLPDIATALRRTSSVTAALRAHGIDDYVRASTVVSARHATAAEAALLRLDPGAIVLVTESLDTLTDGTPLQYGVTRFSAQRVRLDIEHPPPPA